MPRRPVENNNWARLGELVMKYWKGELSRGDIEKHLPALMVEHGCIPDPGSQFQAHFDEENYLHVVFPTNPWSPEELKVIEKSEAYKRELGIILMGGCR